MGPNTIMTGPLFRTMPWLLSVCLLMAALAGCDRPVPGQAPPGGAEVAVMSLMPRDIALTPGFVAEVKSSHQVDIVARVSGFLERIAYREGIVVNKGDVLFEMDKKAFIAQLAAENAELERCNAELWTAKAHLDRIRPLAAKNAASKSDLDTAVGRFRTAEALVAQAKARVEKAEVDLSYTTMKSPIKGIAGEALAREGAFLATGTPDARLTSVTQMDPIWVEFSVTQNQYLSMRDQVGKGSVVSPESSAYEIEVELGNGQAYPHKGRFRFADPTFNPDTGTFQVRVQLPNPEGGLVPGMFVRAKVKGAFRPNAIVVPQKAVQQTANGHMVYIVNDNNVAEIRPVVVGDWAGPDWVIDQGLRAGERLIVEGFQRLAPGAPVRIKNPDASAKPAPPAGN